MTPGIADIVNNAWFLAHSIIGQIIAKARNCH